MSWAGVDARKQLSPPVLYPESFGRYNRPFFVIQSF
jgi:hypothetical protein